MQTAFAAATSHVQDVDVQNSDSTSPQNANGMKSLEESIPRAVLRHLLLDHGVFVGSRVLVVDRHADAWQTWLAHLGVVASTTDTCDLQQTSAEPGESVSAHVESESKENVSPDASLSPGKDGDSGGSFVDAVLITDPDALFASAAEEAVASRESVDLIARLRRRLRAGGQLIALCSPQTQHSDDVENALEHIDPHPQRREFVPRSWSHPFGDKHQAYRVIGVRIQDPAEAESSDDAEASAA